MAFIFCFAFWQCLSSKLIQDILSKHHLPPCLIDGLTAFIWFSIPNIIFCVHWMLDRQALRLAWLFVGQMILLGLIALVMWTAAEDLIWWGYLAPMIQLMVVYIGSALGNTVGRDTFPNR